MLTCWIVSWNLLRADLHCVKEEADLMNRAQFPFGAVGQEGDIVLLKLQIRFPFIIIIGTILVRLRTVVRMK